MIICERHFESEDNYYTNSIQFLTFKFDKNFPNNIYSQNGHYYNYQLFYVIITIEIVKENKTYVVRDNRFFVDAIIRSGKSFGSLKRAREYVDKLIKQYDYKLVSEQEFKKIELLI